MNIHSVVATNLENLQVLEYFKQSDANGVQRETSLATWNGRTVLVDDDVPVQNGYYASTSGADGALKVVASSPSSGEIALATVKAADFYPTGVAANDYVVAGTKYITYLLGQGAFDYCDCGAKVPNEVDRDPATTAARIPCTPGSASCSPPRASASCSRAPPSCPPPMPSSRPLPGGRSSRTAPVPATSTARQSRWPASSPRADRRALP